MPQRKQMEKRFTGCMIASDQVVQEGLMEEVTCELTPEEGE